MIRFDPKTANPSLSPPLAPQPLTGGAEVPWQPLVEVDPHGNATAVWFRATFDLPTHSNSSSESATGTDSAAETQSAYALDVVGLNKGVAYVNGFNIGRYWLENGSCHGNCAPPAHGMAAGRVFVGWEAEPEQEQEQGGKARVKVKDRGDGDGAT